MRREIQPEVSKALFQKLGIKMEERMRINASFSNKKATMTKEEKEHNAKRAKKQKNFEHKKKLQKESKKWKKDIHLIMVISIQTVEIVHSFSYN